MSVFDRFPDDPVRILDADGSVVGDTPDRSPDALVELARTLRLAAHADRRASSLRDQGRLHSYRPVAGFTATQVASAAALDPQDTLWASRPTHATALVHQESLTATLRSRLDPASAVTDTRVESVTPPRAAAARATGAAWGSTHHGDDAVALCYVDGDATSSGAFHEACGLASALDAPVVFVCVPTDRRQAERPRAAPAAHRMPPSRPARQAEASGLETIRVDGSDPLAVSAVTAAAVEHARGQPTDRPRAVVIEAVGCRVTDSAAASSSRLEQHLRSVGVLDAADIDAIEADARARVAEAVDEAIARGPSPSAETPPTARTVDDATGAAVVAGTTETRADDTGAEETTPGDARMAHARSLTPRQAIHAELRAALQATDDYVLFGSTVDASDRTRREIDALASAVGRGRVLSLPIDTATLVDCAVGATTAGVRPVVTAGGSPAAVAEAVDRVTPVRRSADATLPPVTIRVPTQSVRPSDASAVRSSLVRTGSALRNGTSPDEPADTDTAAERDAGPVVLAPSAAEDAADLFAAALRDPRPAVVFDPPAADHARTVVPRDREPVVLEGGSARVVRRGDDVTVFTAGATTRPTLRAAERLVNSETDCTVVDLRTLAPLDHETIRETFRRTGRAVVVEPAVLAGGLASEITALLQAESLLYQEAPVVGVTPTSDEWLSDEQFSHSESARTQLVRDIERGIKEAVEFRP